MAKAIRVLAVVVATATAFALLAWGFVFGRCEGWKGTGTCPRVPLWDWEMFWIVVWAGVLPTFALRVRRDRLLRSVAEAVGVGVVFGAFVVVVSGI